MSDIEEEAAAPRPARPTLTSEVKQLLRSAGAMKLARGLAAAEGVSTITKAVLSNAGIGGRRGMALMDCGPDKPLAAARARGDLAEAILSADAGLCAALGATDEDGQASPKKGLLAISRALREITTCLRHADGGGGGEAATESSKPSSVVTFQTEDERSCSIPTYSAEDVDTALGIIVRLYNLDLRAHFFPLLKTLKKMAYYAKKELSWPDPRRVSLESLRRDPSDSPMLLFRRLCNGVLIVAAGEKVGDSTRDEGAGAVKKGGVQWANGNKVTRLLNEVEEMRDRLTEAQMVRMCDMLHHTLHKSTEQGSASVSLAVTNSIPKVLEFSYQMGPAPTTPKRGKGGGEGETKARPRKRGAAKVAQTSKRKKTSPKEGAGARGTGVRELFADKEGESGPNGLPRMKGGNPAGAACARFARGNCAFATCSFSHAGGA